MIINLCSETGKANGVHEYEITDLNNSQVDFQFSLLNNPSLANYDIKIFGKESGVYADKTMEVWDGTIEGGEENKNHLLRDVNRLTKNYEDIKIQFTLIGASADVDFEINYSKRYIR